MPKYKITLSRTMSQLASFVVEAETPDLAWEILADSDIQADTLPWHDCGSGRQLFELYGIENKPPRTKVDPAMQKLIDADIEKGKEHVKQLTRRSRTRVRRRN